MSHLTMKGNDTVSEIMRKMGIRALIAALLLAASCGMTAGTIARADEGKNLTHMPMPAAPAIPGECNRECLYGFVDKFFSALESRWPGNMPLAPEVKYTENEVPVALGEGIWKTFWDAAPTACIWPILRAARWVTTETTRNSRGRWTA